jgi:hypothetical protein
MSTECDRNLREQAPDAEEYELRVQEELNDQFLTLKKEAKGLFDAVKGRRGAYSEEYWQHHFKKAKQHYASGKFLLERLGADRYLDLPLFATLAQLREGLLRGIENPTSGDRMLADTAIIAYHNILRIQGWIGSTSLVVNRELFGQEPLTEAYGSFEADRIGKKVEKLESTVMPLLDRAQRMLIRAVDRLEGRRNGPPERGVSIGSAGQVNVGSPVRNVVGQDSLIR